MKILVTGSFGFIGSYLISMLIQEKYNVGAIARSVPHYLNDFACNCDVYIWDIRKPNDIPLREKYDFLVHLAGANDVDSKDALNAIETNVYGTKNVLDICLKYHIPKIIYFSTFQVYGLNSGHVSEKTPTSCLNDYALTHYFAEQYIQMYHRNFGLNYIILRPTNVFGAFLHKLIDRWTLVPNCFCKEAYEQQSITLMSSGKQYRDFISLEDVCRLIIIMCVKFEIIQNSIINVASGKSNTILEVAQITQSVYSRIFNRKCQLNIGSGDSAEYNKLNVDISVFDKLNYKFSNFHSLEEEIEKIFKLLGEFPNGPN